MAATRSRLTWWGSGLILAAGCSLAHVAAAQEPPAPTSGEIGLVFSIDAGQELDLKAPHLKVTPRGGQATQLALIDDGSLSIDTPGDRLWTAVGRFGSGAVVRLELWEQIEGGIPVLVQGLDLTLPSAEGATVRVAIQADARTASRPPAEKPPPSAETHVRELSGAAPTTPNAPDGVGWLGWLALAALGLAAFVGRRLLPRARGQAPARLEPALARVHPGQLSPPPGLPPLDGLSVLLIGAGQEEGVLQRLLTRLLQEKVGEVWLLSRREPLRVARALGSSGLPAAEVAAQLRWLPQGSSLADLESAVAAAGPALVLVEDAALLPDVEAPTLASWMAARLPARLATLSRRTGTALWVVGLDGELLSLPAQGPRPDLLPQAAALMRLSVDQSGLVRRGFLQQERVDDAPGAP